MVLLWEPAIVTPDHVAYLFAVVIPGSTRKNRTFLLYISATNPTCNYTKSYALYSRKQGGDCCAIFEHSKKQQQYVPFPASLRMASEESSSASGGGATAAEAIPPEDGGAGEGNGGAKEVLAETAQSEKLRLTAEKLKLQVRRYKM